MSIIQQLEVIFFERGAPKELLTDNEATSHSKMFSIFARAWGTDIFFRYAHVSFGNSIVERFHCSIVVIAGRKSCSVATAVCLYNLMLKHDCMPLTAPVNMLYRYTVRIHGKDSSKGREDVNNTY